jgi:hypothetical protein
MALHYIKIRCGECLIIYAVRKPNRSILIPKIIALIECPYCHPEALKFVCAACGLPFAIVEQHSNGQCNTCVVRLWRFRQRYKQAALDTMSA